MVKKKSLSTSVNSVKWLQMTKHSSNTRKSSQQCKTYRCNICGKSFYSQSNLTEHLRKCIPLPPDSKKLKFECSVCGKDFGSENYLREHFKTNTLIVYRQTKRFSIVKCAYCVLHDKRVQDALYCCKCNE